MDLDSEIVAILNKADRPLSVKEIHAKLVQCGWTTPYARVQRRLPTLEKYGLSSKVGVMKDRTQCAWAGLWASPNLDYMEDDSEMNYSFKLSDGSVHTAKSMRGCAQYIVNREKEIPTRCINLYRNGEKVTHIQYDAQNDVWMYYGTEDIKVVSNVIGTFTIPEFKTTVGIPKMRAKDGTLVPSHSLEVTIPEHTLEITDPEISYQTYETWIIIPHSKGLKPNGIDVKLKEAGLQ